jgi:putative endonuclease
LSFLPLAKPEPESHDARPFFFSVIPGFTTKYNVHKLVYFEAYEDVQNAILREKELKHFKREWKVGLIEKENPGWVDLYGSLL